MTDGGDEASSLERVDTKRGKASETGNFPRNSQVLPQMNSHNPLKKTRGRGLLSCYLDKCPGGSRPITALFSESCLNRAK